MIAYYADASTKWAKISQNLKLLTEDTLCRIELNLKKFADSIYITRYNNDVQAISRMYISIAYSFEYLYEYAFSRSRNHGKEK